MSCFNLKYFQVKRRTDSCGDNMQDNKDNMVHGTFLTINSTTKFSLEKVQNHDDDTKTMKHSRPKHGF